MSPCAYTLRIGLVEVNPLVRLMMAIHPGVYAAVKIGSWLLFRWLGHHGSTGSRWLVVAALAITVAWNIVNIVFWKRLN